MEEERRLTIKDIFTLLRRHIKAVVVVTLAGILAFTALIWLWYNRSNKKYTVSYELVYPNSETGTYPDGTYIIASEFISKDTLTDIKNGVYSSEENSKEFSDINVKKMVNEGDIKITVDVANSGGSVTRTYTVTALAKYFSNEDQAEKFLTVVANYPVKKIMSIIEDNKYGRYLTVFEGAKTYEEKIAALLEQKRLLLSEYENVRVMGGSIVIDNSARVTNILNDDQVKGLKDKIEAYYYKWDVEEYLSNSEARLKTIERQTKRNEDNIKVFEELRDKMIAAGNTIAVAEYDIKIAQIANENLSLENEKTDIEKTIEAIEKYTDDTTQEYKDKQDFDILLSGYYNALSTETQSLKSNLMQIYGENTRVVYVSNFTDEGGLNLILAAVIGAVIGFIIAAIAVVIAHGEKFKAEKYAVEVGEQPANSESEATAQTGEQPVEDELITVSGVIGDGVADGESGAIHQEENLQALVAAEILAEESAGNSADDNAPAEEVKEVSETAEPAVEEKKAAKKPAAKKSTSASAKSKSAAKATSVKSTAKPAAKKTQAKKTSAKNTEEK